MTVKTEMSKTQAEGNTCGAFRPCVVAGVIVSRREKCGFAAARADDECGATDEKKKLLASHCCAGGWQEIPG